MLEQASKQKYASLTGFSKNGSLFIDLFIFVALLIKCYEKNPTYFLFFTIELPLGANTDCKQQFRALGQRGSTYGRAH